MSIFSVVSGTPVAGRAPTGFHVATPQRLGASIIAAPSTSQVCQSWGTVCAPNETSVYAGSHAATPTTSLPPSLNLRPINKQCSSTSLAGSQKMDSQQQVSGSDRVPPVPRFQGVPTPLGGSLANVAAADAQQTQPCGKCAPPMPRFQKVPTPLGGSLANVAPADAQQAQFSGKCVPPVPRFQGVPTPLGGSLANVAPADVQQAQPSAKCAVDGALQGELESLRRTVFAQQDKIVQLTNQLDLSRLSEEKFRQEAQAAQATARRLADELRLERLARQQAEAAALECPIAPGTTCDCPVAVSIASAPAVAESPRGKIDVAPAPISESRSRPPSARSTTAGAPRNANSSARRRMHSPQATPSPSPPGTGRAYSSKDGVDARLQEWLDRNKCDLEFRRLNHGWYAFRHIEDKLPLNNDQTVELRIVNNKLMAKLEPTTHDAGWNNGKLGPIERFVAAFSG